MHISSITPTVKPPHKSGNHRPNVRAKQMSTKAASKHLEPHPPALIIHDSDSFVTQRSIAPSAEPVPASTIIRQRKARQSRPKIIHEDIDVTPSVSQDPPVELESSPQQDAVYDCSLRQTECVTPDITSVDTRQEQRQAESPVSSSSGDRTDPDDSKFQTDLAAVTNKDQSSSTMMPLSWNLSSGEPPEVGAIDIFGWANDEEENPNLSKVLEVNGGASYKYVTCDVSTGETSVLLGWSAGITTEEDGDRNMETSKRPGSSKKAKGGQRANLRRRRELSEPSIQYQYPIAREVGTVSSLSYIVENTAESLDGQESEEQRLVMTTPSMPEQPPTTAEIDIQTQIIRQLEAVKLSDEQDMFPLLEEDSGEEHQQSHTPQSAMLQFGLSLAAQASFANGFPVVGMDGQISNKNTLSENDHDLNEDGASVASSRDRTSSSVASLSRSPHPQQLAGQKSSASTARTSKSASRSTTTSTTPLPQYSDFMDALATPMTHMGPLRGRDLWYVCTSLPRGFTNTAPTPPLSSTPKQNWGISKQ
ncbi:hypothetical protein HDU76_005094 [Blyttiomyces sp. JEL0837]|nr:hypothetical protein HDU76_005094 [Blyttiomyces sp. JEL0837]